MPAVHRLLLRDTCKYAGPATSNATFEAGYRETGCAIAFFTEYCRITVLKPFEKMQYLQHMNMLLYNGPASRTKIFLDGPIFPKNPLRGTNIFSENFGPRTFFFPGPIFR